MSNGEWVQSTVEMPPAGQLVKMKFQDGTTEWYGNIILELSALKPAYYELLFWWKEKHDVKPNNVFFDF